MFIGTALREHYDQRSHRVQERLRAEQQRLEDVVSLRRPPNLRLLLLPRPLQLRPATNPMLTATQPPQPRPPRQPRPAAVDLLVDTTTTTALVAGKHTPTHLLRGMSRSDA